MLGVLLARFCGLWMVWELTCCFWVLLQAVVTGGVRPVGRERPATPVAAGHGAADEGQTTSSKQEGASSGFGKGYRRKDGCPVPDWYVDKHGKDKDTWKTKKEMDKSGVGGVKRRRY